MVTGLNGSFDHNQNGMTRSDMQASVLVAERLNEVIVFRSSGPWAKRWLEWRYPSKNFHVKGKSSDWGPHAGLVPYDGVYSKVGFDAAKAAKGTAANVEGLHSGFAGRTRLTLTLAQIQRQLDDAEGKPRRTALYSKMDIPNSRDMLLTARRSGDQKLFLFRAFYAAGRYEIRVYPQGGAVSGNPFTMLDRDPTGAGALPFEVMTSNEAGAGNMPMTGDYDLFTVCPTWGQYGSRAATDIVKPGIELNGGRLQKGMAFRAGTGMDNVMDPRLHTMGRTTAVQNNANDFKHRQEIYRRRLVTNGQPRSAEYLERITGAQPASAEHGDMGNLTPRILRCMNQLNTQMGAVGARAALRRVHHNAESHRFREFAALTHADMTTVKPGETYGDGFPLIAFQPPRLPVAAHYRDTVLTLESLNEFRDYAGALKDAGFYVPKNWIWQV